MKSPIPYKELATTALSIVAFTALVVNPGILLLVALSTVFSLLLTGIVSTDLFHNYQNKNAREALKRAHRIERKH